VRATDPFGTNSFVLRDSILNPAAAKELTFFSSPLDSVDAYTGSAYVIAGAPT
jgi:hypothetical protein